GRRLSASRNNENPPASDPLTGSRPHAPLRQLFDANVKAWNNSYRWHGIFPSEPKGRAASARTYGPTKARAIGGDLHGHHRYGTGQSAPLDSELSGRHLLADRDRHHP